MTGTLPSIPLSQNFDENGLPQSGCRLFVYEANTSTPVITYKDFLMTSGAEHSWPITADAMGRIPMFFVPDGFYRARLEERDGAPIYDEPQLPALSTGDGLGGGGEVDPIVQWAAGDFLWQPVAGPRDGWVRANGRTIGNAVSGASERAHADCANLFAFLWNNFSEIHCPVIGGRGANGPADFTNNKQIVLLDMRGVVGMGMQSMGGATLGPGEYASFYDVTYWDGAGSGDTPGSRFGSNAQIMSVAEMPSHTHTIPPLTSISYVSPGEFSANVLTIGGNATGYTGGNARQNNVQAARVGAWFVRL